MKKINFTSKRTWLTFLLATASATLPLVVVACATTAEDNNNQNPPQNETVNIQYTKTWSFQPKDGRGTANPIQITKNERWAILVPALNAADKQVRLDALNKVFDFSGFTLSVDNVNDLDVKFTLDANNVRWFTIEKSPSSTNENFQLSGKWTPYVTDATSASPTYRQDDAGKAIFAEQNVSRPWWPYRSQGNGVISVTPEERKLILSRPGSSEFSDQANRLAAIQKVFVSDHLTLEKIDDIIVFWKDAVGSTPRQFLIARNPQSTKSFTLQSTETPYVTEANSSANSESGSSRY